MNRRQMQRLADREKENTRLRRELENRKRSRKRWTRLTVLTILAGVVFAGIFAARVTPIRVDGGTSTQPTEISFHESHVEWLGENYNYSVENGFCLFGHIEGEKVVVEQVEFVDNPLRQSYKGMSFTCIPQILARWKSVVLQEDYKMVGAIHTHPGYAGFSERDVETFRFFDPVLAVFGVYNGEELRMYSDPGQEESLTNVLRTS